jgi:hypothetical protein|tara:strand:- start:1188 stop:1457 length:270 start_codon:yes stop_codon:yes gene_type:complete
MRIAYLLLLSLFIFSCDEPTDCNGDVDGSASIDDCGLCTGGDTGLEVNYLMDECGVCGGDGILEGECDCDSNVIDECGECGGSNKEMMK